jgi:hypothetical protein
MKIIISEKEFYEIDMPAQISINQISVIADKLYKLNKIFGKDIIVNAVKNPKTQIKHRRQNRRLKPTREQVVNLLKIYTSDKSVSAKEEELKKLGIDDYERFSKASYYFRNKFKITPEELGLIRFPTRGENSFERKK